MQNDTQLIPSEDHTTALASQLAAGQAADRAAAATAFARYRAEKSANTLKAHDRAIATWTAYLDVVTNGAALSAERYTSDPSAWQGVTWGLVEGFRQWMLQEGYAIASVNLKLICVKGYIAQAARVGTVDENALRLIDTVKGYHKRSIARNIDAKRVQTRIGDKKADATTLSEKQIAELKAHYLIEATPQSLRDLLLLCLLSEHGLRVSELEILSWHNVRLAERTLRFYRPKVDQTTTHRLTSDTFNALTRYRAIYPQSLPADFALLLQTTQRKKDGTGGQFKQKPLNRRAIQRRAAWFGTQMAIAEPVGCHDFRHHCATQMARAGHSIRELMDWFSWTNAGTAMRYVQSADIAIRRE
jgi:integrase